MLDHAAKYHERVRERFLEVSDDMRFQFAFGGSYRDAFKPVESTWNGRQYVSVHSGDVIGYFAYSIDRDSDIVYGLQIVNFTYQVNPVFSKDLASFLRDIFEKYKHRKLRFTCMTDNPVLPSYKRICERFGGRVVGTYKQEDKLLDGEYHDRVIFEVLRSDYMEARNGKVS